jgi:hypothetical protein
MVSAVSTIQISSLFHAPRTAHVPAAYLKQLFEEVRRHGPDRVFDNRANRAQLLRQNGDEESAQEVEKEAGYILDVFV